jgi:cobalt-zinc-cadmium resistance protein CzcA
MFRPMAQVVSFALIGATILSLTYVPMVSTLFLSKNTEHKPNFSDKMMNWFHKILIGYPFALKRKLLVSASVIAIFIASLFVFSSLGGDSFSMEEGDWQQG